MTFNSFSLGFGNMVYPQLLSLVCVLGNVSLLPCERQTLAFQKGEEAFLSRLSSQKSAELVTITTLVSNPSQYHTKVISVRGTVTQLELHVDDTGLVIKYVFVLQDGTDTLIVFGKHDQTQGGLPLSTDQRVEVIGIFWKDRIENDYHFKNNLEAFMVMPYPPLTHDAT